MRCVLWLLLLVLPLPALADGWAALERDGAIAIMRHALAPGGGDPAQFVLEDCETQRNLDARCALDKTPPRRGFLCRADQLLANSRAGDVQKVTADAESEKLSLSCVT